MDHSPIKRHRRSLRLDGYDYAQAGACFITICTQGRACLFGKVTDGDMCLSDAGALASRLWSDLPGRLSRVDVDVFVVMPNHVHGILVLADNAEPLGAPVVGALERDEAATRAAPTVGDIVGSYKSSFTVEYIRGVRTGRYPEFDRRVWQRNYYEHIIRDEPELNRVRRYIEENPLQWAFDRENPRRLQMPDEA